MADDGMLMFVRNFKEYPQSSNVYPSLAGGLYARWKKSLAIENYQESVQLDLQNKNGSGTLVSNFETGEKLDRQGRPYRVRAFRIHITTTQAEFFDAPRPLVFGRAFAHLDGSNERIPGTAAPILLHRAPRERTATILLRPSPWFSRISPG